MSLAPKKFKRILFTILGGFLMVAAVYMGIILIWAAPKAKPGEGWQVALVAAGIALFFLLGWFLWRKSRRMKKAETPSPQAKPGALFSERYPRLHYFLENFSLQGIGLHYLTYFDQQPDGSVRAAKWFTVAFMPVFPVQVDCIQVLEERDEIMIPMLWHRRKFRYTLHQSESFPRKLKWQTFLFYFGFFFPALFGPLVLFLWAIVTKRFPEGAGAFYLTAGAYFIWGILLVFLVDLWKKRWNLKRRFV